MPNTLFTKAIVRIHFTNTTEGQMNKQSPVDYLVTEIEKIGFSSNNILEFYDTVNIAKEMEAENNQERLIKESNPGLFNSPYAIEPTPKITREEVWMKAWVCIGASITCHETTTATKWADKCLDAFDERFSNKGGHHESK
jgi:hypothetical protein